MSREIKSYIVGVGSMYVNRAMLDPTCDNFSSIELTSVKKKAQEIDFKDAMKVASATNGKIYALKMEEVTDFGESEQE